MLSSFEGLNLRRNYICIVTHFGFRGPSISAYGGLYIAVVHPVMIEMEADHYSVSQGHSPMQSWLST